MIVLAAGVFLFIDAIIAIRTGRERAPRWSELVLPAVIASLLILVWVAWSAMSTLAHLGGASP